MDLIRPVLVRERIDSRSESIGLGNYKLQQPLVAEDAEGALTTESRGVNLGGNILREKAGHVLFSFDLPFPGGLKLSTLDASTVSMAGLWPLIGRRVYGDIGCDVLKDLVVQFDYETSVRIRTILNSRSRLTGAGLRSQTLSRR